MASFPNNSYYNPYRMGGFTSTDFGRTWGGGLDYYLPSPYARAVTPSMCFTDGPEYDKWDGLFSCGDDPTYGDGWLQSMVSRDGGAVWDAYDWNQDLHPADVSLVADPYTARRVYLAYTSSVSHHIVIMRSTTGGEDWEQPSHYISTGMTGYGIQRGISLVVLPGDGDELFACWAVFAENDREEVGLACCRSTDAGDTWSSPEFILMGDPGFGGVYGDHKAPNRYILFTSNPSADVDPNTGWIWVAWTNTDPDAIEPSSTANPTDVYVTFSTDRGVTWEGVVTKVHPDLEATDQWSPRLKITPEGTIFVFFYDSRSDAVANSYTQMYLAKSTDSGLNWSNYLVSDLKWIPTPIGNSDDKGGLAPGLSCDEKYLYVTWNDNRSGIQLPYTARYPLRSTVLWDEPSTGYNMLSVPVIREDMRASVAFPNASWVKHYNSSTEDYDPVNPDDLVTCRTGYWVRYTSQPMIQHGGAVSDLMEMDLNPQWNIIGSISTTVNTQDIVQTPANNVITPYWAYQNGYVLTSTIEPGKGYWVKAAASGKLLLQGEFEEPEWRSSPEDLGDEFVVEDAGGGRQLLYIQNGGTNIEMPPDPPSGAFNVRFANGNFAQSVTPGLGLMATSVYLKNVTYPVTISWRLDPGRGLNYWMWSGNQRGILPASGRIVISHRSDNLVRIEAEVVGLNKLTRLEIPTSFELHQCSPNPFNPTTDIQFDLPEPATISLIVYDLLGRKVADLASGSYEAGYHSAVWNAADMASGVYLARFTVVNELGNAVYTKINKLVLMK